MKWLLEFKTWSRWRVFERLLLAQTARFWHLQPTPWFSITMLDKSEIGDAQTLNFCCKAFRIYRTFCPYSCGLKARKGSVPTDSLCVSTHTDRDSSVSIYISAQVTSPTHTHRDITIYTYMYTYIYIYTYTSYTYTYTYTCTYTRVDLYKDIQYFFYTFYIYIYIYTYM